MELDWEELELEELDLTDERLDEALREELFEPRLDLLEELLDLLELEELLVSLLDLVPMGATASTSLLVRREEELEEDLDDIEEELLERDLLELELELELEELDVLFFRPGTRMFWSFISTFLSSRISSSPLMLITLRIFSAALSPT